MAKKKYLPLYEKWMESGYLPGFGLCNSTYQDDRIKLFAPNSYEPEDSFFNNDWYWGFDGEYHTIDIDVTGHDLRHKFTPMRQNIVLLLACLNNEL